MTDAMNNWILMDLPLPKSEYFPDYQKVLDANRLWELRDEGDE